MTRVRVPIWQKPRDSVAVEEGATRGAVVGRNLYWPDGTLVDLDAPEVATAPGGPAAPPPDGGGAGEPAITFWSLIQQIPANVTALAGASGTGLYTITGAGTSATRAIESDTLDIENANGVAGNPRINAQVRRPAAETISALRVVYESDGAVSLLDPTDDDHVAALLGLAITAAGIGADIVIRTGGTVDDAGWSWSEGFVFAGPNGTLTQTPPAAGWEIVIGYAPSATRLNLTFDEPVLLA